LLGQPAKRCELCTLKDACWDFTTFDESHFKEITLPHDWLTSIVARDDNP